MELDRAWHVSPTAARVEFQREGIVPDHTIGETEVWLMAREDWALTQAQGAKGLFIETGQGFADLWLVDLRGLEVHVHEHIRKHPSVVVVGSVDASRLSLLTTVGDGDHIEQRVRPAAPPASSMQPSDASPRSPARALARLTELAPPPQHRFDVDWEEATRHSGLVFPPDYVELCERYGPGTFAPSATVGGIELLVPGAHNPALDLLAVSRELNEIITYRIEAESPGSRSEVPRGLVAWANGPDVEYLAWNPEGSPESWPVVLLDTEDLDTWTFNITATETLVGLLEHTLEQPVIELAAGGFDSYEAK